MLNLVVSKETARPLKVKQPVSAFTYVNACHNQEGDHDRHVVALTLTLCRSNLNPYCLGRKAAFFSVGI
jgi:hypothetical protein